MTLNFIFVPGDTQDPRPSRRICRLKAPAPAPPLTRALGKPRDLPGSPDNSGDREGKTAGCRCCELRRSGTRRTSWRARRVGE